MMHSAKKSQVMNCDEFAARRVELLGATDELYERPRPKPPPLECDLKD